MWKGRYGNSKRLRIAFKRNIKEIMFLFNKKNTFEENKISIIEDWINWKGNRGLTWEKKFTVVSLKHKLCLQNMPKTLSMIWETRHYVQEHVPNKMTAP